MVEDNVQPKVLQVGDGVISDVATVLDSASIDGKLLYVSDKIVNELYGAKIKEQISKVSYCEEVYVAENTINYADSLVSKIIDEQISCVVGLGGGSVLDVCKYVAYTAKRPLLSIPTTVANDGIASPIAVLKGDDGRPRSLMCSMASMLLIDTEVLASAPIQLIKAGIGDILSNYMALLDWKLASKRGKEQLNGYAYLMSKNAYNLLLNSKHSKICKGFVDELVNAHILSGLAMNFIQSSRAVSGSEHLFSHALDYYSNVKNLHGIQTALGTIAVLKLIGKEYEAVLDCLRRYQVDINPEKLGIDEDSFTYCMQHAVEIRPDRYTYLHEVDLSDKCVKELYRKLVKEL